MNDVHIQVHVDYSKDYSVHIHVHMICFFLSSLIKTCIIIIMLQEGRVKEAAKACATFSYYNPRNTDAEIGMLYYKRNEEVTEEDTIPLHPMPYVRGTCVHVHVWSAVGLSPTRGSSFSLKK